MRDDLLHEVMRLRLLQQKVIDVLVAAGIAKREDLETSEVACINEAGEFKKQNKLARADRRTKRKPASRRKRHR
ncbi:MAG: hypothetical protein WBP79_12125 [Candidatus Acidiferrales bacterium]